MEEEEEEKEEEEKEEGEEEEEDVEEEEKEEESRNNTQDGRLLHPFVFRRNVEGGGRGASAKLWGMIAGAVWKPLFEGSTIAGRPAEAIYTFILPSEKPLELKRLEKQI
ncbi:hypothetical protein Baya_5319 [Bagarius yarrelli]|uniref:Uncharacterized protein n=1 Tax=Bagarius yarrelli TaxID=175774 RepID=A0A556TWG3_BAGYA|nr:hypothetical protein Baya_5319 [Bagarius yarrelli]